MDAQLGDVIDDRLDDIAIPAKSGCRVASDVAEDFLGFGTDFDQLTNGSSSRLNGGGVNRYP